MTKNIFTYGTLRRDVVAGPAVGDALKTGADWQGIATVTGRLYAVAHYPGLVNGGGRERVIGDLWRLRDEALLERVDAYEGPGYGRERRTVTLQPRFGGKRHCAWVYRWLGPVAEEDRIPRGDWLER